MKRWIVEHENKHAMYSLLCVTGLNLGFRTWAINYLSNRKSNYRMVIELTKLVFHSIDPEVSLENFPYHLSEKTKILLISAGYVHLTQQQLYKHANNLSPINRAILLSGPGVCEEFYQHCLAKALAHNFESKMLFLDLNDLSAKMHDTYGCSATGVVLLDETLERVSGLFGSLSTLSSKLYKNASSASKPDHTRTPKKCVRRFCFEEKHLLDSLYRVLVSISKTGPVILYIKNVEEIFLRSRSMYSLFKKLFDKLSGPVLILGSRTYDSNDEGIRVDKKLTRLFPYNIEIKPPQDATSNRLWKDHIEDAEKKEQLRNNTNYIVEVLAENDIDCDDLNSISYDDVMLLRNHIKEIAASAIFYQLMVNKQPEYRNGKLIMSAKSLCHVSSVFQDGESIAKDKNDTKESKNVASDNAYEKIIRQELIPANKIEVCFSDIGALDDVKESLHESVMLPLRRPDLFKRGGILKPCKGVLLFGPPGTGKTMLAKAIANEAGASFINLSSSTITDMWYGNSEKNVRAVFTLAAKVAPTIIFIDEVDSLLGSRSTNEQSVGRRIKNEFMSHWDGLLSKPDEKITVLGATNLPFGLDEAVIRRFHRRIMVGLPSAENREAILKTLLAKEKHEDIDFKELSAMTEGYSGSDLKNLCNTAAYRPIKELMEQEKEQEMKKRKKLAEVENSKDASDPIEEDHVIVPRPLNMEDIREAKNKVTASYAAEGSNMKMLEQWNDLYGEGGSRKKEEMLTYFI
ncbi:peroxisomal ATPase PEX6-like [Vicia villosa]|uniref:peroxisomal ATPase PEX6-like n=1 Tax=Vicia villosa TaxID=3911 RepID=UPI00273BD8CF|nr:peroxisomal ATPase PEX6-like [Vicia villosa]